MKMNKRLYPEHTGCYNSKDTQKGRNIFSRDLRDLTRLRIALHRGGGGGGFQWGKRTQLGKVKVQVWLWFKICA